MNYYNKGAVYIRLIPETNEVLEVFSIPGQIRAIRSTMPAVYQQTVQRIADHQFTQITDQEFIPVYINVKNEL